MTTKIPQTRYHAAIAYLWAVGEIGRVEAERLSGGTIRIVGFFGRVPPRSFVRSIISGDAPAEFLISQGLPADYTAQNAWDDRSAYENEARLSGVLVRLADAVRVIVGGENPPTMSVEERALRRTIANAVSAMEPASADPTSSVSAADILDTIRAAPLPYQFSPGEKVSDAQKGLYQSALLAQQYIADAVLRLSPTSARIAAVGLSAPEAPIDFSGIEDHIDLIHHAIFVAAFRDEARAQAEVYWAGGSTTHESTRAHTRRQAEQVVRDLAALGPALGAALVAGSEAGI